MLQTSAHVESVHGPVKVVPALLEGRGMGVDPEYRGEAMAFTLRLGDFRDLANLLLDVLQSPVWSGDHKDRRMG